MPPLPVTEMVAPVGTTVAIRSADVAVAQSARDDSLMRTGFLYSFVLELLKESALEIFREVSASGANLCLSIITLPTKKNVGECSV